MITVPSASDADIARATQRSPTRSQATIAAAPEQWYSFKPMWPPTAEEAAELEARAARMLGGDRPGGRAAGRRGRRRRRDPADRAAPASRPRAPELAPS